MMGYTGGEEGKDILVAAAIPSEARVIPALLATAAADVAALTPSLAAVAAPLTALLAMEPTLTPSPEASRGRARRARLVYCIVLVYL